MLSVMRILHKDDFTLTLRFGSKVQALNPQIFLQLLFETRIKGYEVEWKFFFIRFLEFESG
jgi:hypothetical protein